jgi:hypothetical protein
MGMIGQITQEVFSVLPCLYVDPFADSSLIPTLLGRRASRQLVILARSGGADVELFGY